MFANLPAEVHQVLNQRLIYLGIGIVWLFISFPIAKAIHFFQKPKGVRPGMPSHFFRYGLIGFVVYFSMMVVGPFIIGFWVGLKGINFSDPIVQGWILLSSMLGSAIGVLIYTFTLPHEVRETIWGDRKERLKDFFYGVFSFFFAYPAVIVIHQIVAISVMLVSHNLPGDQAIVHYIRKIADYPDLFILTIFVVVLIIPFVEEILFRGFLQNQLVKKLGNFPGLSVTSVIFASVHFSLSQGIGNIELLLALFVLSVYLGIVYRIRRSLWSAIGLHLAFNFLGISLMLIQYDMFPSFT